MASLRRLKDGRCRIEWYDGSKKRRSVSIGSVSDRNAERFRDKISELVQSVRLGLPMDDSVAKWLAKLDDQTYGKLVGAKLCEPRASDVPDGPRKPLALGAFIDEYVAGRTDVKESTRTFYRHTVRNLKEFFGPTKPLAEITEGDADDFLRYLKAKLNSEVTACRRCSLAKTFFHAAVRYRLIEVNPFRDISAGTKTNPTRQRFISRETIERIMEIAPDAEYRLLIALARFGGLRMPSEALSLKWSDVDWDERRIRVAAPKTEHYIGKGQREIPIFHELAGPLREAFEQRDKETEFVISRHRPASVRSGTGDWQGANLRTQFERLIKKAGEEPWPRLWQNLRSTRETELTQQGHPLHVVTHWLGNSAIVAAKHYLQVTPDDFDRATSEKALKPAPLGPAPACTDMQSKNNPDENGRETKEKRSHDESRDRSDWAMRDSNPRHLRCKRSALAN